MSDLVLKILELVRKFGYSQRDVAKSLNVNQSTISRILSGTISKTSKVKEEDVDKIIRKELASDIKKAKADLGALASQAKAQAVPGTVSELDTFIQEELEEKSSLTKDVISKSGKVYKRQKTEEELSANLTELQQVLGTSYNNISKAYEAYRELKRKYKSTGTTGLWQNIKFDSDPVAGTSDTLDQLLKKAKEKSREGDIINDFTELLDELDTEQEEEYKKHQRDIKQRNRGIWRR